MLKWAVHIPKTTTSAAGCIFLAAWVVRYGVPSNYLTAVDRPFGRNVFSSMCTHVGRYHSSTTAYDQQAFGHVASYNETVVTFLQHYIDTY